jgi:formylglycine-generating enzyme required for sulfatase activity
LLNGPSLHRALLPAAGLIAAVVASAAAQSGPQSQTAAWAAADWNPKPMADDFVLPLPCGGSMAFRVVGTSGPHEASRRTYLEDRQVLLGGADDEVPSSGYLRTDFVAGPFEDKTNARYYLLGKYEVTNQQYDAVMAPSCDATKSDRAAYPKSAVGWFDAVEFTRKLDLWIYANKPDAMPKASGKPGFARLPTEAEWEFAARGGLAVGDAERGNRTFVPANADLSQYAWFAGPSSSAGKLQPIGALKPNPLGLFDILGNAEELVFDQFRLNRVGRLHGQPGGMVVRGGSYLTSKEALRSSSRTEIPLFDPSGKAESRLPQIGFRVAIGATAFSDLRRADAMQHEWNELRRSSAGAASTVNPIEILERMLRDTTNPEERRQLRDAIAQIGQDSRLRNEMEDRAIKGLWAHAVTVRGSVLASANQIDGWKKVTDEPDASAATTTRKQVARDRMVAERGRFDSFLSTYLDLVIQLSTGFQDRDIAKQANLLRREFELLGDRGQLEQLDETLKLVQTYQRDNRMRDTKALRRAIVGERTWLPR